MTEPTDSELEALFVEETGFSIDDFPAAILDFARAVLAKWGTPPAVAGEPVAYRHMHDDGWEYYDAPTGSDCPGCKPLYTTPQPTQAQAGAVPLTDEQIDAAAKKLAECMEYPWEFMPEPGRKNMRKHAQDVIDAAHGIKGGQHGL